MSDADHSAGINTCEDCGKIYRGGQGSFYCPRCRNARIANAARENAKRRHLNKLGLDARTRKRSGT